MSTPLPFGNITTTTTMRRRLVNGAVTGLTTAAAIFAVTVFVYIVGYLLVLGGKNLNVAFFTQLPPDPGATGGGMGNAIIGSAIVLGLASLFGIPLGIFSGLYLAEFGSTSRFGMIVRFAIDILNGIPTILFGLFAWVLIVVPNHSSSAEAGGVALGIIMIPIITRTTEEVLRLVPVELREAALALGVPEWRMLLQVIIPSVRSGIITGVILALARVAGETAPLLLTVASNPFWSTNVSQPIDTLPSRVYSSATTAFQVQVQQSYAGAFVLIALITLTSFAVRWATGGFSRQGR